MSSIGKISSSILSIPAELTVTAANLNFDFSLVRVEAPKEFHGVRDALSNHRRNEAESGMPHVTARKLGALFEPLVPPTPHLLRAYGERVSEISNNVTENQGHTATGGFGIFASQAGPDATSIWAAATSGRSALAVQLLACMLARIWKEHEAISLWAELVERRKAEVNNSAIEGSNIAALIAAQQIFTREQLAAWDSSARSWIKTADTAKRFQQTQLMLIISNMEIPVNSSPDLYESVIKAWTTAMTAMDRLVQGMPQQIRDGATLLAISAWHLYPDMAVLSNVMKTIQQNDPLMDGSLLTFPVHLSVMTEESNGVFWSLPMARMRYYSPPVIARGCLTPDTSRVSMNEFLIVILGIIISPWLRTFCPDASRCCRLIFLLREMTKGFSAALRLPDLEWLSLLSGAADLYLSAEGILSEQYAKLLGLGIRSRSEFLNHSHQLEPAFELSSFDTLLSLIPAEMVEAKIAFLRQVAVSLPFEPNDIIIKYRPRRAHRKDQDQDAKLAGDLSLEELDRMYRPTSSRKLVDEAEPFSDVDEVFNPIYEYEYASALPYQRSGQKRAADETSRRGEGHRRWAIGREESIHQKYNSEVRCLMDACGCIVVSGPPCPCAGEGSNVFCTQECHPEDIKCWNTSGSFDRFPIGHPSDHECEKRKCTLCYN